MRSKSSTKFARRLQSLPEIRAAVLAVVAAIPEGRITTYGLIAEHLELTPRQVASALARTTEPEVGDAPWYRVVAANGVVSAMKVPAVGHRQIARLRAEGFRITPRHTIADFRKLVWFPVARTGG